MTPGGLIYADDQYVNQQSIKRHCEDLKIGQKLTLFNDGQDVIDHLDDRLTDIKIDDVESTRPVQPYSLLLLDINMPIKNGFDTLNEVKELYAKHNKRLSKLTYSPLINARAPADRTFIMRPMIVFFSQM